jgi:hypothetical protein
MPLRYEIFLPFSTVITVLSRGFVATVEAGSYYLPLPDHERPVRKVLILRMPMQSLQSHPQAV